MLLLANQNIVSPFLQTDGVTYSKTSFFRLVDLVRHNWLPLLTVTCDVCSFIIVLTAHPPKYVQISACTHLNTFTPKRSPTCIRTQAGSEPLEDTEAMGSVATTFASHVEDRRESVVWLSMRKICFGSEVDDIETMGDVVAEVRHWRGWGRKISGLDRVWTYM